MLVLRNVTKIRVFVLFNHNFTLSSVLSFSSSALSSITHFSPTNQFGSFQVKEVAGSFKEWFNSRNNALLDQIFFILSAHDVGDPSSLMASNFALSQLGFTLSEGFVLEVLAYGKDILSCLKFFHWAGRQKNFTHTCATFHAFFKKLSRSNQNILMVEFMENYVKPVYDYRIRLNNVLVLGYAIAGKSDFALHLFGKMRFKGMDLDSFSYNVLLNTLVDEGRFSVACTILTQIFTRGFENKVTRSIMMKSLCKQNKLEEGEAFIRILLKEGYIVTGFVVGYLIDGLCKIKKFDKAGILVEEFRRLGMTQTERCYAVWIKNMVHSGRVDRALEFLRCKKTSEGYAPDMFGYNLLICRLLKQNRPREVCDLLAEMTDRHIAPDDITINAVSCFFCIAGMVDVALEMFNSRSEFGFSPNTMSYDFLITHLCWDGSIEEAFSIFNDCIRQGYLPGRRTFSILADSLCREGELCMMKKFIAVALERNSIVSATTYDMFIQALCRMGMVEDGYWLHEELHKMNHLSCSITYIALIQALVDSNKGNRALRLLIEMQDKCHYCPTQTLFQAVIKCVCDMSNPEILFFHLLEWHLSHYGHRCLVYNMFIDGAGFAQKSVLARQVFEMMTGSGVMPNLKSYMLMLQIYLEVDCVSDAFDFFESLPYRAQTNSKLYKVMIVGLCRAEKPELALKVMRQMKKNNLTPSLFLYEIIVNLLCSKNEYDMVVSLLHDLGEVNRVLSSGIGNKVLFHSLKGRKLYWAWDSSIRMKTSKSPHLRILGNIIAVFSGCISLDTLHIEDLEKAIEGCFPININTYNLLLRRLSTSHMDLSRDLFMRFCQKGHVPNSQTFEILASGFFNCGKVTEANRCLELSLKVSDSF